MFAVTLDNSLWLMTAFFTAALVYSSAGFGGGSTYLALLALSGLPMAMIPVTALACNIVAVIVGVGLFSMAGHLRWRLVLPFMVGSVPAAYLGGTIPLGENVFFILLGFSLLASAGRLAINPADGANKVGLPESSTAWLVGVPVGALLGLLSGMTGIGGGVFLAPVLYFMGWGGAKTVAVSSGLFILANSLAGLAGQMMKPGAVIQPELLIPLTTVVACGALCGAGWSAFRFSAPAVRRVTAVLIAASAVKILWEVSHA